MAKIAVGAFTRGVGMNRFEFLIVGLRLDGDYEVSVWKIEIFAWLGLPFLGRRRGIVRKTPSCFWGLEKRRGSWVSA